MVHKVLVIDDDPRYVDLLRIRLEHAGYEVVLAFDGETGLARAHEEPRPDLVLTDVLLPKKDGFEICRALKSDPATRSVPVVLMSAIYITEEDHGRGLELGAQRYVVKPDAFIEKPIRFDQLLEHIRYLLGETDSLPDGKPKDSVLLVDDDPRSLRMLDMTLGREPYEVLEAASARVALEILERRHVDLVLSDVRMPGMDGLELLREIRRRQPRVSVVMMTAHGSEEVAVEAMKSGANDYLTKPIDTRELAAVLRENLEKHRLSIERERLHQQLRDTSCDLMTRLDALDRQNQELEESNRRIQRTIQAQSDFVSTVSHELRTPMTVIKGALALATQGGEKISQDQGKHLIERARAHTERVISLVEKLLDFQRIDAGIEVRRQQLDLVAVLGHECETLLPAALQAGMRLTFTSALREAPCTADPEAIERIVANLVGNAFKYAPRSLEVEIGLERHDEFWRISVSDRGPGVAAGLKERIFERFARGETPRPHVHSTGLGLAIVKTLAEQHGGRVGVQDREGGGAIFWFELPRPKDVELARVVGAVALAEDLAHGLGRELDEHSLELRLYPDAASLLFGGDDDLGVAVVDLASQEIQKDLYSLLKGFETRGLRQAFLVPPAAGGNGTGEASRLFDFVDELGERPSAAGLARLLTQ